MSRRKPGFIEKLIDICGLLPWWLGVVLALAAYVVLHSVSDSGWAAVLLPGLAGMFVGQPAIVTFASYALYVLPAGLLLVSVLSLYARASRGGLHDWVTGMPTQGAFDKMSWPQFENLVVEAFRRKGYSVTEKLGGLDGAADLVLKKSGKTFLVQFKHWRAIKVGVNAVREFREAMIVRGAAGGYVLTSGEFTEEVLAFAKGRRIKLMDGRALRVLLRGVSVPAKIFRDPLSILTRGAPFCPECQGRMRKRKATKGPNVGKEYWRCLRYPDCKGKRPL